MKGFASHLAAAAGPCRWLGGAQAADPVRIVVVTHGANTDSFWNVVKNGVTDAAKAMNVTAEYRNPPTGDLTEMARLIDAAVASKPAGLIVSIPDPDALGAAIKGAVAAGVPTVSINSGSEVREKLGVLFHVGQPDPPPASAPAGGPRRPASRTASASTTRSPMRRWNSAARAMPTGWASN